MGCSGPAASGLGGGMADGLKTFDVWTEWTENLGCQKS